MTNDTFAQAVRADFEMSLRNDHHNFEMRERSYCLVTSTIAVMDDLWSCCITDDDDMEMWKPLVNNNITETEDALLVDVERDCFVGLESDESLTMMDVEREYFCNEGLEYSPHDWSPINVVNGCTNNTIVPVETSLLLIDALCDEPPSADSRPISPLQRKHAYQAKDFDRNCGCIRKFSSTTDNITPKNKATKHYKSMRKPCSLPRRRIKWKNSMPVAHPVSQQEYRALSRILTCGGGGDGSSQRLYCSSSRSCAHHHLFPFSLHPDDVPMELHVDIVLLLADVEDTIITPGGKLVATNVTFEIARLAEENNLPHKLNGEKCSSSANASSRASSTKKAAAAADGKPPPARKKKPPARKKKAKASSTANVTVKSVATKSVSMGKLPITKTSAPKARSSNKGVNVTKSRLKKLKATAGGNEYHSLLQTIPEQHALVELDNVCHYPAGNPPPKKKTSGKACRGRENVAIVASYKV